jgi:5-methylthioribose kinase
VKNAKKEVEKLKKEYGLSMGSICSLFEKYRPQNYSDIRAMGFKLTNVGSGLFRSAYRIDKSSIVVKLPKTDSQGSEGWESGVGHAREEFKKINKIQKTGKYAPLVRYLPHIYYFDKKTGIMIMPLYYPYRTYKERQLVSTFLSNLVYDLHGGDGDIHSANVASTEYGEPVLIDLGYF